jgi:transposase-like protein
MDFPLSDLMDEQACYDFLIARLHPDGLACPRCHRDDDLKIHRQDRVPIIVYRCPHCRRIFNAFTGTVLHATKRRPREWVLILRGFAQGVPTARLARELDCDRSELLKWRHRLQALAFQGADQATLPDTMVEADELYQNAGEKRRPASRPGGSATSPRQSVPWSRQLGQRSSPGLRGGRSRERAGAVACRSPGRSQDVGRSRGDDYRGGDEGQHR